MLRSAVIAAATSCALLAACRSGAVPNQVLTKPAPASATVPAVRTAGPWIYRPSEQRQQFVVDQHAIVAVQLDSSTHTDTVSTHAEISFVISPATNAVSGTVGAFAVQSAGRAAATPARLAVPFPVRAEYSARELQLDFSMPRDAGPCSSTALAAVQSLRDLWFRPPDTLRVGTLWGDSSSYVVCRDGIPLRATVHRFFHVAGAATREGRVLLTVVRSSVSVLDGSGMQFGEAVSVSGSGSSFLTYDVDPASGEVVAINGNSSLDFSLRSRRRTQVVHQLVETRIGRR
jgi:hypothetical protein